MLLISWQETCFFEVLFWIFCPCGCAGCQVLVLIWQVQFCAPNFFIASRQVTTVNTPMTLWSTRTNLKQTYGMALSIYSTQLCAYNSVECRTGHNTLNKTISQFGFIKKTFNPFDCGAIAIRRTHPSTETTSVYITHVRCRGILVRQ